MLLASAVGPPINDKRISVDTRTDVCRKCGQYWQRRAFVHVEAPFERDPSCLRCRRVQLDSNSNYTRDLTAWEALNFNAVGFDIYSGFRANPPVRFDFDPTNHTPGTLGGPCLPDGWRYVSGALYDLSNARHPMPPAGHIIGWPYNTLRGPPMPPFAKLSVYDPVQQLWGVTFRNGTAPQFQPKPTPPPQESRPTINWRSALTNPAKRPMRPVPLPFPKPSTTRPAERPRAEPSRNKPPRNEPSRNEPPTQNTSVELVQPATRQPSPSKSLHQTAQAQQAAPPKTPFNNPTPSSSQPPPSGALQPLPQSTDASNTPTSKSSLDTKAARAPKIREPKLPEPKPRPIITKLIDVPLAFRMAFPGSAGVRQIAKEHLPQRRQDLHDASWPFRYPAVVTVDLPELGVRAGDEVIVRSKVSEKDPRCVGYASTIAADGTQVKGRSIWVPNSALAIGIHAAHGQTWLHVAGYGNEDQSGLSQQDLTSPLGTALALSYTAWKQTKFPTKDLQWLQIATDDKSKMDRLVQGAVLAVKSAKLMNVFSRPDFTLDDIFTAGKLVRKTNANAGADVGRGVYGLRYSDFPVNSQFYGQIAFKVGKTNMATAVGDRGEELGGGFSGRWYAYGQRAKGAGSQDRHGLIAAEAGKSEMVVLAYTDDPLQQTLLEQFFTCALDSYRSELHQPEIRHMDGAIAQKYYDWVQCLDDIMPEIFQASRWPGGLQRANFVPQQTGIGMNISTPLAEGGFAKKSWLKQTLEGNMSIVSRSCGTMNANGSFAFKYPQPTSGDLALASLLTKSQILRIFPKDMAFSPEDLALLPDPGQPLEVALELTEHGGPHTFSFYQYPQLGRRSDHRDGLKWALRFQWPGPDGKLRWIYVQYSQCSSDDLNRSPPASMQAWATAMNRYFRNQRRSAQDAQSFDLPRPVIWNAKFLFLQQCWFVAELDQQRSVPPSTRKTDQEMEEALIQLGAVLVPRGQRADRDDGCDGCYLSGSEYVQEGDYCVLCNRYERPCTSTADLHSDPALRARLEAALCPHPPSAPRVYTGTIPAFPFEQPF